MHCIHAHLLRSFLKYKTCTQRKGGTWAERLEGTVLDLGTPDRPQLSSQVSYHSLVSQIHLRAMQRAVREELWPRTGGHWGERTGERWWGCKSSTVVWRKWKLLCICQGDPGAVHRCWYTTRSYHVWSHIHPLSPHHQSSLLNLLLMYLFLSNMLVQDFPLSLGQHLCINWCL